MIKRSPTDTKAAARPAVLIGVVIGLVAGRHCLEGHEERLRAIGVTTIARDFEEVSALLR